MCIRDRYDTFISELVSWFNASASALEEETGTAINVEVVDAAGSQTTQNEQVKSLDVYKRQSLFSDAGG